MELKNYLNSLGIVNRWYHLWNNGTVNFTNHYFTKISRIISNEDAHRFYINDKTLIDNYNEYNNTDGVDDTYFVEIIAPVYDNHLLYAVLKNGELSLIETGNSNKKGVIDITGKYFKQMEASVAEQFKSDASNLEEELNKMNFGNFA